MTLLIELKCFFTFCLERSKQQVSALKLLLLCAAAAAASLFFIAMPHHIAVCSTQILPSNIHCYNRRCLPQTSIIEEEEAATLSTRLATGSFFSKSVRSSIAPAGYVLHYVPLLNSKTSVSPQRAVNSCETGVRRLMEDSRDSMALLTFVDLPQTTSL